MSSSLHKPLELHFLPALHILKLQDFLSPSTVIESMDEYTTTMGTFAIVTFELTVMEVCPLPTLNRSIPPLTTTHFSLTDFETQPIKYPTIPNDIPFPSKTSSNLKTIPYRRWTHVIFASINASLNSPPATHPPEPSLSPPPPSASSGSSNSSPSSLPPSSTLLTQKIIR
ncbi:hypothetical protein PGT21_033841 [Puccinia graminis f. sp. tritici]|uniref:Uncharacterized protein n=1 Tax=Puccinia graminis f. sp. tritici TaxID=56615 RepID=A0A5B0MPP0_PUCGR|nr:hypothetical protein PGT21_033841 [Puccinia graminis f. sp. tritici]